MWSIWASWPERPRSVQQPAAKLIVSGGWRAGVRAPPLEVRRRPPRKLRYDLVSMDSMFMIWLSFSGFAFTESYPNRHRRRSFRRRCRTLAGHGRHSAKIYLSRRSATRLIWWCWRRANSSVRRQRISQCRVAIGGIVLTCTRSVEWRKMRRHRQALTEIQRTRRRAMLLRHT